MSKLQTLIKQVETCRLCPLCRSRHQAVPGEGNEQATVLLIGEGPGYHEDREGRPFIGPAGQFLEELLGLAGLTRSQVYITNVVKCRPPNNRDPLPDEIEACAPYLDRQIATINPQVIVTLGRYSMAQFVNETSISRIHGKAWQVDGRLVVTMYHPAAGLHNGSLKEVIREDFRRLPDYLTGAGPRPALVAAAPVAPTRPSADALALLDAYALERATPPAPAPVPPTVQVPVPEPEPPVGAAEAPPVVLEAAPPDDLHSDGVSALVAPAAPTEPVRRGRGRKATVPILPVEEPAEPVVPPALALGPVAARAEPAELPTNGHHDVPPAPPMGEAPVEPPAPARKKDKPAAPAEQLSFF